MNELKGEYILDFYDVKDYIEKHAKAGERRNEALETLHGIYLEAQENETPLSEIHEGSAKEYAKEIVEGLPHMAPEKRRIIKRILTVVLAAVFVLAAYFTSDYYYMQIGGFNYKMRYPDKFWGAPYGPLELETYIAYVSVSDNGSLSQDENLENIGIYFEGGGAPDGSDDFFSVTMRSKTEKLSPTSYTLRVPGFSFSSGEFYWVHNSRDITAKVCGLPFVGEIERVDGTGYDMIYDIYFRASDENADYSGISKKINSGETIEITFEDIHYYSWNYKGLKEVLLVEGYFPFFIDYKYRPAREEFYEEKEEPDVYYYLKTSDGKAQAVVRSEYNEELGGQEFVFWESIPKKLDESLDWVESGEPYLDDEGLICVEITEVFKDGTRKNETVKSEKKTKLVYSDFIEYTENKAFEVRINAERDADGKFTEIQGNGWGVTKYNNDENGDPIYTVPYEKDNWESYILENGDAAMEISYYKIDEPEKIIEETVIFNHKKY